MGEGEDLHRFPVTCPSPIGRRWGRRPRMRGSKPLRISPHPTSVRASHKSITGFISSGMKAPHTPSCLHPRAPHQKVGAGVETKYDRAGKSVMAGFRALPHVAATG